ncbi:MAG TPA: DUF3618 domain-containing protein [Streptosporangiaceae bacterium]|nr:DUF3618 domain-containing protein [Streptosporangiaceae bacterium]
MSAADSSRGGRAAPGRAVPDDPQALVDEINRTRAELGETVEALAARVDVKARAQQRAAQAGTAAWNAAPVPVRRGARRVAGTAGQYRMQAAVAAGAVLVAGWLVLRRRHR